jgi:hypothetical protein
MDKKRVETNLFAKTEQPLEQIDLEQGNIRPQGIGMREGELAALAAIGRQIGEHMDAAPVARNAIARIAIRRFIEAYKSGEITPQELAAYFDRPDKPQPKLRFK